MATTATRGASGCGTIRKRSDGRWEARVTVGYDPKTGKQIQRSVYGKTQKEVTQKMRALTAEVETGSYTPPSKLTVGEWIDIWIAEYTANVKECTRTQYKANCDQHIKPTLGHIKLSSLTLDQVQRLYNGFMRGDKPIAPKTVKNIHGAFHRALGQAVRLGYIKVNPSDNVTLPRVEAPELTPLTDEDLAAFINAIKGHTFEDLYLVDLFTGLRRSEIIGLTWDCVDFERGIITIRRQLSPLKDGSRECRFMPTKNSKIRVIAPATAVMDILVRCREKQEEMAKIAGDAWNNPEGFVFTNEIGHHLSHMTVYNRFKKVVRSIGKPEVRLHDLRHSYAIASLQAGDDIKTLQENLGHHTAAFTLNVYGHVSMQMKRASSQRMDAFIANISNASQE